MLAPCKSKFFSGFSFREPPHPEAVFFALLLHISRHHNLIGAYNYFAERTELASSMKLISVTEDYDGDSFTTFDRP